MNRISMGRLADHEVEALGELAKVIWMSCYRRMISDEQIAYMLNQRYQPEVLRQQINAGNPIIVARVEKTLIGFAHLFIDRPMGRLDKLYVDPRFQRQGIGKRLVEAVKQCAGTARCTQLMLRVNRHNKIALKAYERYGFERVGAHCADIGGGFFMDDFILQMGLL